MLSCFKGSPEKYMQQIQHNKTFLVVDDNKDSRYHCVVG